MVSRGSPDPTYDTDQDCTGFLTTLPARIEVEELDEGVNEQALVKMIRATFPASATATSEDIKEFVTAQHNL